MRHLQRNAHSVFDLNYHLVVVTKYRRRVIDGAVSDRLRAVFEDIGKGFAVTIDRWNWEDDHVHVLFKAAPKTVLTKFINAYKSASSRYIKNEFPAIRKKLWKEAFWNQSFCLVSTGGAPLEVIRRYIENQRTEPRKYEKRK